MNKFAHAIILKSLVKQIKKQKLVQIIEIRFRKIIWIRTRKPRMRRTIRIRPNRSKGVMTSSWRTTQWIAIISSSLKKLRSHQTTLTARLRNYLPPGINEGPGKRSASKEERGFWNTEGCER